MAKKLEIKATIRAVDKMTGPLRLAARRIKARLGGALRGIGGIARRVGRSIGGLIGKMGLLGGAGLVGGILAWTKSYVEAGSELAKFSRQVGIGAQRIQELEFAAGLSDISVEKLRGGLSKFVRNIGEAQVGTGELAEKLKKMDRGLLRQIKTATSTGAAFDLMVGAIAAAPDAASRAALATAAFGRSGLQLVTLFERGHIGLAEMTAEFKKTGAAMSGKTLKQTEKFNDGLFRVKTAMKAVSNAVMRELLPIFEPLIRQFTDWLKVAENQDRVTEFFKDLVNGIVEGFPKVVRWFRDAGTSLSNFAKKVGGLGSVVEIAAIALGAALLLPLGPIGILIGAVAWIIAEWDMLEEFYTELWADIVGEFEAAWLDIKRIVGLIIKEVERAQNAGTKGLESVTEFVQDIALQKGSKLRTPSQKEAARRTGVAGAGAIGDVRLGADILEEAARQTRLNVEARQRPGAAGAAAAQRVDGKITVELSAKGGATVEKVTAKSESGVALVPQVKQGRRASVVGAP